MIHGHERQRRVMFMHNGATCYYNAAIGRNEMFVLSLQMRL